MDFALDKVRPLDTGIRKAVLLSIAIIMVSVGSTFFLFGYLLATNALTPTLLGLIVVWIGSIIFFYAVITEEHTMKELFLRHSYFYTGLISLVAGMYFIFLGGMFSNVPSQALAATELGLLLMLFGAVLVVLSAQRYRDYTKNSGLFALIAGILLLAGGIVAGSTNVGYIGVFLIILSGVWMGLRSKKAV
jgi:hypothetical protein